MEKAATDTDDAPMDNIPSNAPFDVDNDHTQPDEGDVPKTPEEGDAQKMSKKISQKPTKTVQTENQLAEPAGKESKIPVEPPPPAKSAKSEVENVMKPTVNSSKLTKSPLSKNEAKSPAVSTTVKSKSEKPNDALTYLRKTAVIETREAENTELNAKVKEVEFSQSTTRARLTEPETKSPAVITAEAKDPPVAAEAAPPPQVASEASKELTATTPTVAEEKPAKEKSEEAKEEAVDEPMKTEAGQTLKPRGRIAASKDIEPRVVVVPKKNMKESKEAPVKVKDNPTAQVQSEQPI